MSKKGSALMQVLVIGLIIAAFAVMMLRYAVTRSANLSRTDRILESQIVADSCLDQYMAFQAAAELSGEPACGYPQDMNLDTPWDMQCLYLYNGALSNIVMHASTGTDADGSFMFITSFTVPTHATL